MTNVLRKKVNIIPQVPFPLKQIIARPMYNVDMSIGDIRVCILKRAIVQEVLPNGKLLNLTLENYNKVNFKETTKVDIEQPKENEFVVDTDEELIPEKEEVSEESVIELVEETNNTTQTEYQYQRKNKKRR